MNEAGKVIEIPIEDILPNRFQPRIKFAETEVLALADSIKKHGVIQPILVRPIGDKYEIIAGERRYKASEMAGKETIPAIIKELDDQKSAELALIENVQRKDLTPTEEALSYKKILDMGYLTQDQLAEKLGKKQSTIANKLRLLNLDEDVQNALLYEKISERHARSLLKLDKEEQKQMLERIMKERLTVRQTDIEIQKILDSHTQQEKPVNNEEIEVLDFPEEELVKTMDEQKVEPNENIKDYNLPTSTIQDDIPEETVALTPNPVMPEVTVEPVALTPELSNMNVDSNPIIEETPSITEDNPMNPGFMDVDKIVETAKDINRPAQKDKKEIEELLKPDEQILKMQEAEKEKNQEAESLLKPGKFFNLADIEDDSEETDSGFVENLDKEQANMDFGVEQAPAPASGFNFDKFFNPNEFEKTLEPTGQQEVMKEEPIQTVEPTVNIEPEVPVDNRLESNETELVSEPNETKPAEIVNLMITPEEIETVEEPVIENKIEEENIIPPVEVYTDVEPASDISPEIVIPKEEEVLPKAEEMNSELTMNNPYLNMSEEEFLNSLPDNDLPLSSIPSTSQEEMPYIPEETKEEPVQTVESSFEPEFDFTTLEPNSNSLEERPIEKEPEIVSPPEEEIVSPVEPIIQENTNSFLFEPLEEEVAPIVSVPEPTVVEPENPSVVVPPIAKEYHTEEPQSVEEKPSAPIFEAGKVNDEVIAFANSLEQKGYHVRIEEYDFEDLYQVVFKIKKDEK